MQVIRKIEDFPTLKNVVVTNGTFDGCHIGHQKILEQLQRATKQIHGKSVVLTYWPHPRIVLGKENNDFKLLYTIEERIELLKSFQIDYLVILEFTKTFAAQTSQQFLENIIIKGLNTSKLIIGYNHRFGKNREGGFDYLIKNAPKFPFTIEEISKQVVDNEDISSTKIRKSIIEGDITTANNFLNSNFYITGNVISGNQLGRTINFPTANISIQEKYKILPKDGVYAVFIWLKNKKYSGMMNIGVKPSTTNNSRTIEVHIFDFNALIYGEILKIELIKRIRSEEKFENLDELKKQLIQDKITAQNILKESKHIEH